MSRLLRFAAAAVLAFAALPAHAGPVTLRPAASAQGAVTLGDIFDGAGPAAGVVIAPAGATVLDAAQVQRIAMQNGLAWANESGVRRIAVRAAAPAAATSSPAAAHASRGVETLTWARNINAGEVVQPEDLTWGSVPAAPSGAAQDPEALIGKAARRPLRAGGVAMDRDVTAPQVIRKDDMITVTFISAGVRLELQAKAKENAAIGESLDVLNVTSGKVIQAIAAAPGRAVVGPEADRLRTLAITDPSRLALR